VNDYLIAIVLGIVEGITEFLPVSSTAHIRLCQDLLHVDLQNEYWKMFAIVIQLGAILSVVVYFWRRLIDFIKTYPNGAPHVHPAPAIEGTVASHGEVLENQAHPTPPPVRHKWWNHPLALVAIAFFVTAGPCYVIDKKIGANLESMKVIGASLLIGGIVMWVVDWVYSRRARTLTMDAMTLPQAIVIGFAQIFAAAFPGTSRSMATIAGGQIMGLSRPAALEFSFFLSIPVMFAATGYKLLKYVKEGPTMRGHDWGVLAVGFVVSFLVAWALIAFFMAWVRRRGFVPFAIYRIIMGIVVLALAFKK
jgi:undecaprenyl-diphosphatase